MFGELLSICNEAVSLGCELSWEKEIEYHIDNKRTSVCEHETDFLFDLQIYNEREKNCLLQLFL